MGFFDKVVKAVDMISKASEQIEKVVESQNGTGRVDATANAPEKSNKAKVEDIVISSESHIVEAIEFADDIEYNVTFKISNSFVEYDCGAAEVVMLNTYSPNGEESSSMDKPYVAILLDDDVYIPVEEYKKSGTFKGAIDLTPLSGKFYFKAKKEYAGDMMYFYGIDRCDGFWENNGICVVYPKEYVGTENEAKLMRVLDEVAETYKEEKVK